MSKRLTIDRLHLLGIRHHGPGSARAMLAALDAADPAVVLIEGPHRGGDVMAEASRLTAFRRRREDSPLQLVLDSAEWTPVVELFATWARDKLGERTGYTTAELDAIEVARGVAFPPVLREWWRLAGKHRFLQPEIELSCDSSFILPTDQRIGAQAGLTLIAIDDGQSGMETGIHDDFVAEPNPLVHGRNPNWNPPDAYRGTFQSTGLTVPELVYTTLLCHLCMAGRVIFNHGGGRANRAAFVDGIEFVNPRSGGHSAHTGDIEALDLKKFTHDPAFGDIFTDARSVIFWWLAGYLCLSQDIAERVRATISRAGGHAPPR